MFVDAIAINKKKREEEFMIFKILWSGSAN